MSVAKDFVDLGDEDANEPFEILTDADIVDMDVESPGTDWAVVTTEDVRATEIEEFNRLNGEAVELLKKFVKYGEVMRKTDGRRYIKIGMATAKWKHYKMEYVSKLKEIVKMMYQTGNIYFKVSPEIQEDVERMDRQSRQFRAKKMAEQDQE